MLESEGQEHYLASRLRAFVFCAMRQALCKIENVGKFSERNETHNFLLVNIFLSYQLVTVEKLTSEP